MKIKDVVNKEETTQEKGDVGEKVQEDLRKQEEQLLKEDENKGNFETSIPFQGKVVVPTEEGHILPIHKAYTTKELEKTVKDIAGAFYGSYISSIPQKYRQATREVAVNEIIEFAKVLLTQLKKEL